MAGLTFQVVMDDGELWADELVPIDVERVEKIEKRFEIMLRQGTIRIAFDPPLLVPPAVEPEEPCR